jgi:hypothetical protein
VIMTISKNIEFKFVVPPDAILFDEEDEDTFPYIDVDASSLDMAWQAVLLRILPLITIESRNGGSNYMFDTEPGF